MKFLSYLFCCIVLFSCSTSNQKSTDNQQNDSIPIVEMEELTAGNLIKNITLLRQQSEKNTQGFMIELNLVYSSNDSSFRIVNFIESYDEYNLNKKYSIAINPNNSIEVDDADKEALIQIQEYLKKSSMKFCLFRGNFTQLQDFQLDGSKDFLLKDETHFRNDVNSQEQIVLFDGKNKLSPTNIIAKSFYTNGVEAEGSTGQKEMFKFKQKQGKPYVIIIEHNSKNDFRIEDAVSKAQIKYSLLWQWNKNSNEWETGLVCTDCSKPEYGFYSNKLIKLSEGQEGFVVKETCQNGGMDFIQLVKHKTELSESLIVDDNEDDVGYYAVINITKIDAERELFYLARSEKFEANMIGNPEIGRELSKWIITKSKEENSPDRISLEMVGFPGLIFYTSNPQLYKFENCNSSN